MKTFEEALGLHAVSRPEDIEALVNGAMRDIAARYMGIAQEANHSEVMRGMIEGWLEMAKEVGLKDVIFSAFITGLITGIEMEKAE